MPKTVFYARVSTRDQSLDLQVDAARRIGVKDEHLSGEGLRCPP
jgi:predicted site-specific integrase-resolvase